MDSRIGVFGQLLAPSPLATSTIVAPVAPWPGRVRAGNYSRCDWRCRRVPSTLDAVGAKLPVQEPPASVPHFGTSAARGNRGRVTGRAVRRPGGRCRGRGQQRKPVSARARPIGCLVVVREGQNRPELAKPALLRGRSLAAGNGLRRRCVNGPALGIRGPSGPSRRRHGHQEPPAPVLA